MKNMDNTDKLLQLIEEGTSPFHVVKSAADQLEDAGFIRLEADKEWGLNAGSRYYLSYNGTSLFAFSIGKRFGYRDNFRIAAAHTDFPCIKIKPNPDIAVEKYAQVNVEIYGGAILNTWLDRPLSVSGRVVLKSIDIFKPEIRLVNFKKPIMTIPNLAIHMNKEVNKGVELNKQTDMLPIVGMITEELNKDHYFMNYLAERVGVDTEDILDYELTVYNTDAGDLIGINEEFISAPRLDNLTSVQALVTAIIDGGRANGINIIALFDHEEIGSRTKQGAGSMLLSMVVEKIYATLGRDRLNFMGAMADSLLLSVDVAHGLHPNQTAKNDPTNKCILNGGVCLKEAAGQTYATDSEAVAIIQQICHAGKIPYQKFVNRSDGTAGSTLGSIASAILPVRTVDAGVPLLAMHSSRELMGRQDQDSMTELVKSFFSL
ncbi:M18 family aminopeptidase [Anaerobium acetethylicum]|uniref:M18 family aminopeptidase n=1 Tax=Anaerobium acetethylicum TaxID=1619234 RepID=A0A1D3TT29_9FIRM|nr:M18 family aminopeptidase [Anaerobium acetethylicum]SCP97103.1 aspartyl aminopeptidase [Anaerobium acetethylicum]